jgi:hypothetical protein
MYSDDIEEKKLFTSKQGNQEDTAKHVFNATKSAGANNQRLSQLLVAWDFSMSLLGWKDVTLTDTVVNYQASINAKYHNDYKSIKTIEELDKRLALRRMQANQQSGQSTLL